VSSQSVGGSSSSIAAGGDSGCTISGYKTKQIGSQVWMAENLNCYVAGSECYNNDPANCATYGRLYTWSTAMGIDPIYNSQKWDGSDVKHRGICPSGWHIPSAADWNDLMRFVSPSCSNNKTCAGAGTKLKATSGWNNNGNGTDEFGFSALPGGARSDLGSFFDVGDVGYWWSTMELSANYAYHRYISYKSNDVAYYDIVKRSMRSVRCVQDD